MYSPGKTRRKIYVVYAYFLGQIVDYNYSSRKVPHCDELSHDTYFIQIQPL